MDTALDPTLADTKPAISVILVNYNTAHLLDRLFAALDGARGTLKVEVIVVDNASSDRSVEILRAKYSGIKLIANLKNVGFGRANNQALQWAQGRYVLLLNTDAFVSSDTLRKTVDFMDTHPQCGVLGVKLVDSNGSLQPACRFFPTPWNLFLAKTGLKRFFPNARMVDQETWDHSTERECDWVPGCYYLIRREVIERVGLFDPRYFLYYEEVDHCKAVRRAGWSVIYYPFTHVIHDGGASAETGWDLTASGRQIPSFQIESELLYFRKHYGMLGLFSAVALAVLGDCLAAFRFLLRRRDMAQVRAEATHSWTMLKLLAKTRLATRPTR